MRAQRIENQLKEKFPQMSYLDIVDESHLHAGRAGQESHFKVLLVSDDFVSQGRLQRQRQVNQLFMKEFEQGLHALSLRLLTVAEYEAQQGSFETPNCQGQKA